MLIHRHRSEGRDNEATIATLYIDVFLAPTCGSNAMSYNRRRWVVTRALICAARLFLWACTVHQYGDHMTVKVGMTGEKNSRHSA
jgi:hypothetical protein